MALLAFNAGEVAAQASFHPQLGASLRNRMGEVQLESGEERRYELEAYAEIVGRLDIRPAAGADNLLSGFETRVWFAHSVGLDTESAGNASTSRFLRLGADVGWLGPATKTLAIGLAIGTVFDGYYLGSETPFPDTRYYSIRPALRVRQQLRGEKLVLDFDAAYRAVVFHRGLTDRFGSDLQVRAFDLTGAVGGRIKGFTWGLRLAWVSYLFEFGGTATEAPATEGNDHSLRMELLVGWMIGGSE